MKVSAAFEDLLRPLPPQVFRGDGFTVSLFFPFAVRYESREKRITFPAAVLRKAGSWWVFGSYLGVYVESPLCWDGEDEPIGARTAEMIISEVKESLDRLGRRHYKLLEMPKGAD